MLLPSKSLSLSPQFRDSSRRPERYALSPRQIDSRSIDLIDLESCLLCLCFDLTQFVLFLQHNNHPFHSSMVLWRVDGTAGGNGFGIEW